jgi:hypothetical protein
MTGKNMATLEYMMSYDTPHITSHPIPSHKVTSQYIT